MTRTSYDCIMPDAAYHKLLIARKNGQPVYVYGATGYGKTTVIQKYLNYRKSYYISGNTLDEIENFNLEDKKEQLVLVIDDLHVVRNVQIREWILNMLEKENVWMFLLSRAQVPSWLLHAYVTKNMIVITEEDLMLADNDIQSMGKNHGLQLTEDECRGIASVAERNGFVVRSILLKLQAGMKLNDQMKDLLEYEFVQYLQNEMFKALDLDVLEFLIQISVVNEFNLELAEYITGNPKSAAMIERAKESGNFLSDSDGCYKLHPLLLKALRSYSYKEYGTDYMKHYLYNAGHYYEMQDNIVDALRMFEACGNENSIRDLLIRSARQNPTSGHYFELRKYYERLSEEDVSASPILMSALSMFHSVMMQPEKSEYWYERLKEYANKTDGARRKEAVVRMAYLDIGLPHRGEIGLIDIFKQFSKTWYNQKFELPEFSVTSGLPSVMNGGKDFCEWSKRDNELARTIGKAVVKVLGRYGNGLIDIALGESLLEKGTDDFSVFNHLNRAHYDSETAGKRELQFVAVATQVRMSVLHGDLAMAFDQLNSFRKKISPKEFPEMWANMESMYCRLYLYESNENEIQNWFSQAPDENEIFNPFERFRYLTKIRCYIKYGMYMKARLLTDRMLYYAEQYKRNYIIMELKILKTIIFKQMGLEWQDYLKEALDQARDYSFVRIISQEGIAVFPLLKVVRKAYEDNRETKEWFKRVYQETEKIAQYYPGYIYGNTVSSKDFGENAIQILKMQAEGKTIRQISEELTLAEATVKYHMAATYRKLNVKGKAEAVREAIRLHII